MAVYTKLTENELKKFFSKYDLGKILTYKEIREGIENTNYFIQTCLLYTSPSPRDRG